MAATCRIGRAISTISTHSKWLRVALLTFVSALAAAATATVSIAQDAALQSKAERTNYEETSLYEDVIVFFRDLARQSPLIRLETFGKTSEGRDMPLVTIANPPVATPREALESGKPIVFVMANIHAGEVEGKEAVQQLARRLVDGDLKAMTEKLIILFAPIYNADSNEKISITGRSRQDGPIGGVGIRENAQGFDLNRDYTKLEAPETNALVRLFNEWDPDVTVDLHTTDGSYHAYHLTYSIPLNPSIDPHLYAYHRDKLMPAIEKAMLERHQFRTYYYGNFASADGRGGGPRASGSGRAGSGGRDERGERGGEADGGERRGGADGQTPRAGQGAASGKQPVGQQPPTDGGPAALRQWRAFSHLPRVGQNYVGFRNRLTILSEAYSYIDFKSRIEVTAAFVEEIMRYSIEHADEIRALTRQADNDMVRQAMASSLPQIGVEYEQRPLPEPVNILVAEVVAVPNPRSGRSMTEMNPNKITSEKMNDYGLFVATRKVPIASAYLFPREDGLRVAVEKLRAHGITVEELTQPLKAEVASFRITSATPAARAFEKHREMSLVGAFETEQAEFPAGTIVVRSAQPLGRLAAYLLEPESDDSLSTWNYLDKYLEPGRVYPIKKLMKSTPMSSRVISD